MFENLSPQAAAGHNRGPPHILLRINLAHGLPPHKKKCLFRQQTHIHQIFQKCFRNKKDINFEKMKNLIFLK